MNPLSIRMETVMVLEKYCLHYYGETLGIVEAEVRLNRTSNSYSEFRPHRR